MKITDYNKLKATGMMWELHPGFTGSYEYDLRERNFIATWKTYEFDYSFALGGGNRVRKNAGQVVYARSPDEVKAMIKQMDAQAHMIEVNEYKEAE